MNHCKHEHSIPTRREQANGVTVVFLQCQQCGGGRAIKKDGVDLAALPPFDAGLRGDYWAARSAEYQRLADDFNRGVVLRKNQERAEWWADYTAYLKSDHWRTVSFYVRRRDPICQKCFLKDSEQAHHLSYATFNRLGFSFPAECVGICRDCHDEITLKSREDQGAEQ